MFDSARIQRPSLALAMSEPMRFGWECLALASYLPFLAGSPRGAGRPVIVLPGFATNDTMTALLRGYLTQLGHKVYPLDLGWNFDHHTVGENGEHLARRISSICNDAQSKVSLVGWSLGGVIAREAARRDPDEISQVITLGAPFTGNPNATNLSTIYQLTTGNSVGSEKSKQRYQQGKEPLPVRSTAIYSRYDGITAWENCLGLSDDLNENIEVIASHFGFMSNPAVFHAVADRLAQSEDGWKPFTPSAPFRQFFA